MVAPLIWLVGVGAAALLSGCTKSKEPNEEPVIIPPLKPIDKDGDGAPSCERQDKE